MTRIEPRIRPRRARVLGTLAMLLAGAALLAPAAHATNAAPRAATWVTDGAVNALDLAPDAATVYLGGTFGYVGPRTGSLARLDATDGTHDATWPVANGRVRSIVPDGDRGWFVGGEFTALGGVARAGIAHVDADGTVDPDWGTSGSAFGGAPLSFNTLLLDGGTLYVGGRFDILGGVSRRNLAALDASSGEPTAWDPQVDGTVNAIALDGSTLHVGGYFTIVNGGAAARPNLASFDTTRDTGNVTDWYPNPNGRVDTLVLDAGTLYVGGAFTRLGIGWPDARDRLAAFDTASGELAEWAPGADGEVLAMVPGPGGTLFVGGDFATVGGAARARLARISRSDGSADGFSADASQSVRALALVDDDLYVGGSFRTIAGSARSRIARLDAGTAALDPWNPGAADDVEAFAADGADALLAGGRFTSVDGAARANLAALDVATGVPTPWDPAPNNTVNAVAAIGDQVYAAGWFSRIGGRDRVWLGSLSATTGAATTWAPSLDGQVATFAHDSEQLFVAGAFSTLDGSPRAGVGAFDLSSGALTPFDPDPTGVVSSIAAASGQVFLGGSFSAMDQTPRARLAAVDPTTGALDEEWAPNPDGPVLALATHDGRLFVGGAFAAIAGTARENLAAFDLDATPSLEAWNPGVNGSVRSIAVADQRVFVTGGFSRLAGAARTYLGSVDAASGSPDPWHPGATGIGSMAPIVATDDVVFAGLSITAPAGAPPARNVASFSATPDNDELPTVVGSIGSEAPLQCLPGSWRHASTFTFRWYVEGTLVDEVVEAEYAPAPGTSGVACEVSTTWGGATSSARSLPVGAPGPEPEPDPDPDPDPVPDPDPQTETGSGGEQTTDAPPATDGGGGTEPTRTIDGTTTSPTPVRPVATCRVPRLAGRRLAVARRALRSARCRTGRIVRVRSSRRSGTVLRSRPGAGARIARSRPVTIVVSLGPRRVT